jgi:outer membrane lipoprotein-sorting protein
MQIVTLLTGSHTTQIAYGGPDKQRVAIFLSDLSETDVVHNGNDIWTYSSDSNTVTHNTLTPGSEKTHAPDMTAQVDPAKAAQQALAEIDPSTKVTVDRTAEVAGRPAYQLDLGPRDPQTLIGSVQIALDAATSMPLRVQIWSRQDSTTPAFSVGFTSISLSAPSDSTFDFSKPPSATMAPSPISSQAFDRFPAHASHHAGAVGSDTAQGPAVKTIGHDWTTVFVAKLHDMSPAPATTPTPGKRTGGPGLAQELDGLGKRVAAGHVITTSLLTILVTNDNRILVGAVTPSRIEQVAASRAAQ